MADDIFEKIWAQLGRIYDALGGGSARTSHDKSDRSAESLPFVVDKVVRTLGLHDLSRFIALATGDLTKILSGTPEKQGHATTAQSDQFRNDPSDAPKSAATNDQFVGIAQEMQDAIGDITRVLMSGSQSIAEDFRGLREATRDLETMLSDFKVNGRSDIDSGGTSQNSATSPNDQDVDTGPRSITSDDLESQLDRIGDLLAQLLDRQGDLIAAVQASGKPKDDSGAIKAALQAAGMVVNRGGGGTKVLFPVA